MALSRVVAAVSGGASGLGAATVARLARQGASVAVLDLDVDGPAAAQLREKVADAPGKIVFASTDVTSEDDVGQALDLAEGEFGRTVSLAVNCAGIAPPAKVCARGPLPPAAPLRLQVLHVGFRV